MSNPFPQTSRRALLLGLGTVALAAHAAPVLARSLPALPTSNLGADTNYWQAVRDLSPSANA